MQKVLSIVPKMRFIDSEIQVPVELDLHHMTAFKDDEIIRACNGMEYLLLPSGSPVISKTVLDRIPSIKMIQIAGPGNGQVNLRAAAANDIPVCNLPVKNVQTVAEFTVAQIITLLRNTMFNDNMIKIGNYSEVSDHFFQADIREMSDIKLGLLGFGIIGQKVAKMARYLGSEIAYCDINRANKTIEKELNAEFLQFDHLFAMCDVVSLHLPLTETTKKIVGGRELDQMLPGSILVNTSHGELVDQEALATALETGPISGAAIDAIYPEPPPPNHPLLKISARAKDRLLITPHIAGMTRLSFKKVIEASLINIAMVSHGQEPENPMYRVVKSK